MLARMRWSANDTGVTQVQGPREEVKPLLPACLSVILFVLDMVLQ